MCDSGRRTAIRPRFRPIITPTTGPRGRTRCGVRPRPASFERVGDRGRERRRRPPDQLRKLPPVVEQRALRCADVPAGDRLGDGLGQAESGEGRGIVRLGQVLVRNRLAALARDFGREVLEREGRVAGELIGLARVALAGQRGDGRVGIVGARGAGDPAFASAADEGAAGERAADRAGVVLRVPAVAQDGERDARGLELGLGRLVLLARG